MPLYDSFSAGSQKSVKLSKMSNIPTTEDLKYAVAEAKRQGKPVEMPFENNRILFVIKVSLQGSNAPRWTFQRGDGPGSKLLWTRDSAEVMMIQNKIKTESSYEQHQDAVQELSASGGFAAYQPQAASGGFQAYQPMTNMSASGGFPAYQEPEPDYSDGSAAGGSFPSTPFSQPAGMQAPFNIGPGGTGFPNAPFNVQSSSGSQQPLGQEADTARPPAGGIPETPFSSNVSASRMPAFGAPPSVPQVQQSTSGRHQSAGEAPKILLPPKPLIGGFGAPDDSVKSWQESAQEKMEQRPTDSTAPGIGSFRQAPQFPKFDSDEESAAPAPAAAQVSRLAPLARPAMQLPMAYQFDNSALNNVFNKLLNSRTSLLSFEAVQFFLLREFSRFQQYEQSLAVLVFEIAIMVEQQMQHLPVDAFPTVAERLRGISSPLDIAAHMEDSEFIVLLSNGDDAYVNKFMESLSKSLISTPLQPHLAPGSAMVAIGAASIPNTCNHPGIVISAAKAAKEEAKSLSPSYLLFPTGK
ncbi:MAG: hypothetical protein K2X93_03620 [Candidatus Obscuribacterales bacterium]|nr:hypothetical protein [Candidatus Obscuribacterales bacterium]